MAEPTNIDGYVDDFHAVANRSASKYLSMMGDGSLDVGVASSGKPLSSDKEDVKKLEKGGGLGDLLGYLGGFLKYQIAGGYDAYRQERVNDQAKSLAATYFNEPGATPQSVFNKLQDNNPDIFRKADLGEVQKWLSDRAVAVQNYDYNQMRNDEENMKGAKEAFWAGKVWQGKDMTDGTGASGDDVLKIARAPVTENLEFWDSGKGERVIVKGLGLNITPWADGVYHIDLTKEDQRKGFQGLLDYVTKRSGPVVADWIMEKFGMDPLALAEFKTDETIQQKMSGKTNKPTGGGVKNDYLSFLKEVQDNYEGNTADLERHATLSWKRRNALVRGDEKTVDDLTKQIDAIQTSRLKPKGYAAKIKNYGETDDAIFTNVLKEFAPSTNAKIFVPAMRSGNFSVLDVLGENTKGKILDKIEEVKGKPSWWRLESLRKEIKNGLLTKEGVVELARKNKISRKVAAKILEEDFGVPRE